MRWGDAIERGSLQRVLDAVTEANVAFAKLTDVDAGAELFDAIELLKIDQLREIVLARVLAEQLAR